MNTQLMKTAVITTNKRSHDNPTFSDAASMQFASMSPNFLPYCPAQQTKKEFINASAC